MKITATIITLNEERKIARAIESLRCCDEIVVVDSGSTDRTVELASQPGRGAWWRTPGAATPKQKNWAADQAAHDWILSLDADEALSEALEGEIWSLKKNGPHLRRLHDAAPGAIPGPLDPALRLVSGPQSAPVPSRQGEVGGRVRA